MRLKGYMLTVTWDGAWLIAEPSNKMARFALLGSSRGQGLELHRDRLASIEHHSATLLTNGRIVVSSTEGQSYRLHYRRKAESAFAALAAELAPLARGRHEPVRVTPKPVVEAPRPAAATPEPFQDAPKPVGEASHPLRRQEVGGRAHSKGSRPNVEQFAATMELEEPRHPLDEQVEVPNEQYYTKGTRRVFRDAGLPITSKGNTLSDLVCVLVPEPWNPHDPNAVAVLVGGHQIGHLPADLAEDYAAGLGHLAAGGVLATGSARIWAKDDGGMIRARATLLIPEADAL